MGALSSGARGWVPLDQSLEMLREALAAVSAGEIWLPRRLSPEVVARLISNDSRRRRFSDLTPRQFEILQCVVDGMATRQIAAMLFISPNTVRTHRGRLFAKLGVRAASEAVALARAAGLSPRPQDVRAPTRLVLTSQDRLPG